MPFGMAPDTGRCSPAKMDLTPAVVSSPPAARASFLASGVIKQLPARAKGAAHKALRILELLFALAATSLHTPYTAIVPLATREALQSLASDALTAPSLGLSFWERHLAALRPTSLMGWLVSSRCPHPHESPPPRAGTLRCPSSLLQGLSAALAMSTSALCGIGCLLVVSASAVAYISALVTIVTTIVVVVSSFVLFFVFLATAFATGTAGLALAGGRPPSLPLPPLNPQPATRLGTIESGA